MTALKKTAQKGRIKELEGFGEKTEQQILDEVQKKQGEEKPLKLFEAEQRAEPLVAYLKRTRGVKEITIAGSFRRRQETVGDLDVLVTCKKGTKIMDRFVRYEDVRKVVSKGGTRSTSWKTGIWIFRMEFSKNST